MNTFTDPKTLPCLHVFCLHCLNGILKTSGRHDIITCPECRKESEVPRSGNLNDLPTNFRVNSLLDVLAIKECNTTGVKCGNCDKKSSQSFYCFQCCAFWCEASCISLHNGIKANKEHRVLALKDFKDEDYENVLKRPVFCRKPGHEKKELEFFCKICEVPICNACALTYHDSHAKILLEEAANERKLQAKSVIERHKKIAQENRLKIAQLDSDCVKIEEHVANVKRNVQQFADNMIAIIEAQKQEIFDEVENQAKESIQRLEIQKSEIENQVKMTEAGIEQTEALLKRNISAEIIQTNKILDETFQGQVDPVYLPVDNQSVLEFDFVRNQKLFDGAWTDKIGYVKMFPTCSSQSSASGKGISVAIIGLEANFLLTTKNVKGEQSYEKRDYVSVGHDCATEVRVQDNKDGSYKISYFAKGTEKCRLSVKVNGEYVRGSPFAVEVKPRQFRPVLSFGQHGPAAGEFNNPWGVAVNERDEIAVTESGNHRVQVFSSNGTYLRSFGTKGDKQGELNWPAGIAFDNNAGNVVIADCYNNRVQQFSGQGEYLTQFAEKGDLDHQLKRPLGLSLHSDGSLIVADLGNKQIKIFSRTGQFIRKIDKEGFFNLPCHCVEHDGYLVVSDCYEHCIIVFDKSGTFLYKFGKQGTGDGEFNKPEGLSINKAGHLCVCDAGNHRIQVFELSGKFVTKFGTKGEKIGEFNVPISTAVLGDGRIVVTDYGNHRIQIFE